MTFTLIAVFLVGFATGSILVLVDWSNESKRTRKRKAVREMQRLRALEERIPGLKEVHEPLWKYWRNV